MYFILKLFSRFFADEYIFYHLRYLDSIDCGHIKQYLEDNDLLNIYEDLLRSQYYNECIEERLFSYIKYHVTDEILRVLVYYRCLNRLKEINIANHQVYNVLETAILMNDIEWVTEIFETFGDLLEHSQYSNLLSVAIINTRTSIIEYVAQFNKEYKYIVHGNCIQYAVATGNYDVFITLLKQYPDLVNKSNVNILMDITIKNNVTSIAKYLMTMFPDLLYKDDDKIMLKHAIDSGHQDILEYLLTFYTAYNSNSDIPKKNFSFLPFLN